MKLVPVITLSLISSITSLCAQNVQLIPDPLSWSDCVALALQHNVELRQAETQLEEAEGAKFEFRSRVLPRVQMTAITFPPLATLEVQQMVFDQRAILGWEASELAGSVSRLNYELRLNEVMTELRIAYLNLILVQEQEKLTQSLQEFLIQRRANAKSLFETGNLRKSELQQVEVRLDLIRDALILLLERKLQAKNNLLIVMGIGEEMGVVSGSFDALPERPVDRKKLLEMGITGMPEVRLLETLAAAGEYQARIARAERIPNVYLYARAEFSPGIDALLGREGRGENSAMTAAGAAAGAGAALVGGGTGGGTGGAGSGSTAVDPATDTTGLGDVSSNQIGSDDDDEFEKSRGVFGLRLRWNAIDRGSSEGRAIRRDADTNTTYATILQFKQALPGQVEEAFNEVESARENLLIYQDLPSFSDSLKMAQSEYEGGRAGQNETLVFAADSFQGHSRLIQEKYRASLALTVLRRISGQLLAFTEESAN